MREIKFRGWDIKNKIMFDVNCINFIDGITNQSRFNSQQCIFKGLYKEIVLMQYTGLKDKNEQEIYEGDILRIGTINGIVKYFSGKYVIVDKNDNFIAEFYNSGHLFRVIGNIYENPELLTN